MAKANVANTRVVPTGTSSDPYYNDYDESKNFHQMIFRPGYAVQGRELTQLQTILQNQIERFGLHIFENGSSVIGGETSLTTCVTLNLESTFSGSTIVPANFKDKTIRYSDSNNSVIARVIQTSSATETEPPALHIKYQSGSEFQPGDTIKIEGEETYANLVPTANATAFGQLAWIYDSIYFYDGYFVKVPKQSVITSKYTLTANVKIGLESDDTIVTEDSDSSLLDPALGASNYQAPGAHRFKKELILSTRDLSSTDDSQFIEILRLEKGSITKKVQYPIYSEIEEVFARRTYDESGSYTVKQFNINMQDDEGDNANNVSAVLSPGKAYVTGYEFETIGDSKISIPRAREKANVLNHDLNMNYGNYVIVDNLEGVFNFESQELVDIHSVPYTSINFTSQGNYDTTKIGTARVRDVEFFSIGSSVYDVTQRRYEFYLFNTQFTGSQNFSSANSFVKHATYTSGASGFANCNISTLSKDNGLANGNSLISEPSLASLVFPFPETYVAVGSISNQSYQFRKLYTSVTFTDGVGVITAGTDEQFIGTSASSNVASTITDNFLVVVEAVGASGRGLGDQVAITTSVTGAPETATLTTGVGGGDTFTATIYAKMEVDGSSAAQRTKSLTKANTLTMPSSSASNTFIGPTGSTATVYLTEGQVVILNPTRQPDVRESLYISDVIAVPTIWNLDGAAPPVAGSDLTIYEDVTNKYTLDTGQRDTYYDHASIRLKPGVSAPRGPLIVSCRFYVSTTDRGYFSVDSYPLLSTEIIEEGTALGTGYSIIPYFTTTAGEKINLRDCIDFRPVRRSAANTSSNFTLNGAKVPIAATDFESNYSYYLGRRDLIVLTPNRLLKRIAGTPSKYPQNPTQPTNSMVLYTLSLPPYTAYPSNVAVQFIDNRRYTMRDIGIIDKRLRNVEYYVTLNSLEKDAIDISIPDVNGLERTKYGILADNFNGHQLGDSDKFDYNCAVNYKQGWMQSKANTEAFSLIANTASTSNVSIFEDKIFLNYTEEEYVNQNTATKFTAIAEFLFADFEGTIITVPDADIWKSVNSAPAVVKTTFENQSTFDTITVQSQTQAQDAINDVIGGDTLSRNRWRGSRGGR